MNINEVREGMLVMVNGEDWIGKVISTKPAIGNKNCICYLMELGGTGCRNINSCYVSQVSQEDIKRLSMKWRREVDDKIAELKKALDFL